MVRRPPISVIVVNLNEGDQLRQTVEHLTRSLPSGSEIIVVDDGSTDGSVEALAPGGRLRILQTPGVGVARARNTGGRAALGDILVFADAHISMEPGCWEPLVKELQDPRVGAVNPAVCDMQFPADSGYGMSFGGFDLSSKWLYDEPLEARAVPLLIWACAAMRKSLFDESGGFDEGMIRWGSIDNEMSVRLWLEGYELRVVPGVRIAHLFRTTRPYAMSWSAALHNRLRLAFVHFDVEQRARVVDALRGDPDFPEAVALTVDGDIGGRRRMLMKRRVRDSTWWFAAIAPSM
jgi:GT2 family glycosyltransferase